MAKLKSGTRVYGSLTVDTALTVNNDTTISGNLIVLGTTTTVNSTTTTIADPLIELGGGANGAALTSNDAKDRGQLLHYYDGKTIDAFMGWNSGNSQFALASNVSVTNNAVTINTYGNLKANVYFGDAYGLSNVIGANVTGTVAQANNSTYAGTVTGNAQANITSLGTLTGLTIGNATANTTFGNGTISTTGEANIGTLNVSGAGNAVNISNNLVVTGTIYGNISGSLAAPGTNTQIMFNDAGGANATSGFTFNKTSNTLTVGGDIVTTNGGKANISGNINFAEGGVVDSSTANSVSVNAGAATGFAQLKSGTSYATVNINGVTLEADSYAVTLNNLGNFSIPGNLVAPNVVISTAGTINANGNISANIASFADIYSAGITSGRILIAGANGLIDDNSSLTYTTGNATLATGNVTVTGTLKGGHVTDTSLTTDRVTFAGANGQLTDSSSFVFTSSNSTLTVGNATSGGTITGGHLKDTSLTSGRITFATTNGQLADDTALTYVTGNSTLFVGNSNASGKTSALHLEDRSLTAGRITFAGVGGELADDTSLTYTTGNSTISVGNANVSGTVAGGHLKDTSLTSGRVTFATTGGQLADDASITYDAGTGKLTVANLEISGTANLGFLKGDGYQISNITGANVTGNVTLSNNANYATTVTGATQSNITAVGTLTSLNVSGNLRTDNYQYANGTAIDFQTAAGNATEIQFKSSSGNDLAASSNFTFDAANATMAITGNITTTTMVASGNIQSNANIITDNIIAKGTTNITITAGSTNGNVVLAPQGTGAIDASSKKIVNLATPTSASDAVNKSYVDGLAQGLDIKSSVRVSTTASITLSGTQTIDGVALSVGDRVLVRYQTNGALNGIYVVASGSWTRADDAVDGKLSAGSFTFVEEGTNYGDTGWVVGTNNPITVGTTAISWTQFSAAGTYTANNSAALTLVGTELSVKIDGSTIDFDVNGNLKVKDSLTLVTPNIGVASGTSLNVSNVTATNIAGTLTTAAQPNITSVGTLTSLDVSGNVRTDNYQYANGVAIDFQTAAGNAYEIQFRDSSANNLAASSNLKYYTANSTMVLDGNLVTGAGSGGSLTGANLVSASYLEGTLTANSNAQPNITSVGNLTSVFVTGTANVGNLVIRGSAEVINSNVSGNLTAGNVIATNLTSGRVTFAGTDGKLIDSSSLTWDGTTLAATNVSASGGNVTGGNVLATNLTSGRVTFATTSGKLTDSGSFTWDGTALAATNMTASSGNVTGGNVLATNLTSGRVTFATTSGKLTDSGSFTWDGTTLSATNLGATTGNVSVANAYVSSLAAGRVTFSASSGQLVDSAAFSFSTGTNTLSATNITASGNVSVGNISGNGAGLTSLTGANVTGWVANANNANYATTVTGASQGNITSLGTLTGLTVNGLTSLGPVGNVSITGGSDGQYLKTDGAGGLSWFTHNNSLVSNGTSNISIASNANITLTAAGNSVIVVSGTGANVTGVVNVSGNIIGNNLTANNFITASGNVDATSAITGTIKTAGGISAQGNVYTGKAVGFANSSGNTSSAAYIQFNATANSLDFIFN